MYNKCFKKWKFVLGMMALVLSYGLTGEVVQAETFSDDFNSGVLDAAKWTKVVEGDMSSISFEDVGEGDKRIHLRAVYDGTNRGVCIKTAPYSNRPYILLFDFYQPSGEAVGLYGTVISHDRPAGNSYWFLQFREGATYSLLTYDTDGWEVRWKGSYNNGTLYKIRVENKPKEVKISIYDEDGNEVADSDWQGHIEGGGDGPIAFGVSSWEKPRAVFFDNINITTTTIKIE